MVRDLDAAGHTGAATVLWEAMAALKREAWPRSIWRELDRLNKRLKVRWRRQ